MRINTEPLKTWFGFTRRERRSSFMLLIIVIAVLGMRLVVPEKNVTVEDITDSLSFYEDLREPKVIEKKAKEKFVSNNKATTDTPVGKQIVPAYRKKPLVNLNNCDTAQLISLPGIGPVLSARIIKYRNLLGGYAAVSQLNEVYGLPPETFELIKDRVYADTSLLIRININSAVYKELSRLPYFEKYEVTAILKYRELKGRIGGVNELVDNKLITAATADKVGPYLKFK